MIGFDLEAVRSAPIAGVISNYLPLQKASRNHTAVCPFHEDRRPSLVAYSDSNQFHCFGCGAHGDAIDFVMRIEGCSFGDAASKIAGQNPFAPSLKVPKVSKGSADNARYALTLWREANSIEGSLAEKYLRNRGIDVAFLKFRPPLRFGRLKSSKTGQFHPAIISKIEDANGALTGIQRTFLTEEGTKHPIAGKTTLGNLGGNATKLGPANDEVLLCEGLEDGLTLQLALPDVSVWVTAGTTNLGKVEIPNSCRRVTIAADNDNAGSNAANAAVEAYLRQGFDARLIHPDPQFKDFNDQLQKVGHL